MEGSYTVAEKEISDIKIRKAITESKTSLAVDGIYIRPEQEELVYKRLTNQITEEEFQKQALEMLRTDKGK